jgi:hypothetical protein
VIRNAKDLSLEQKAVIEGLLGRHVLDHEAISVRAIELPALSDQQRKEQMAELRKYFSEVDTRRRPGSPEEAEEILTEAMCSSRPGFRPQRTYYALRTRIPLTTQLSNTCVRWTSRFSTTSP